MPDVNRQTISAEPDTFGFIKKLAVAVHLFDQVKMAQDGGLLLGNLGHVGKVGLGHSQTVAVKIVVDAGAQVFLAPIDLVIFAGFGALDIVGVL